MDKKNNANVVLVFSRKGGLIGTPAMIMHIETHGKLYAKAQHVLEMNTKRANRRRHQTLSHKIRIKLLMVHIETAHF